MAEPIAEPTTVEPIVEPQSGLPSTQPSDNQFDGFAVNDDFKSKFKNGKLNGRFGSIDEVLLKLKEAEDYKSATISEQKKSVTNQQQAQETQQVQDAKITELMPSFLENGMILTQDMENTLTEGLTGTEKELAIYKFRDGARNIADRTNSAYGVVGGKENYIQMQEWARNNLSAEHQRIFTNDVNGSNEASLIAVEWLNDKYQQAVKDGLPVTRIEGQPHHSGITPYKDRRELFKDKKYIDSNRGRRDAGAIKEYKARLAITSNEVMGIR